MGYDVHFWSDIPGKFSRSSEPGAVGTRTKKEGSLLKSMGSSNWNYTSTTSAYDSIDVDKADFHTHGSPGSISLGGDDLDFKTLERFMNKGYDQIFNAKAEVEFHGCNVAEGFRGEFFLIRFGQTFLKRKGGTVSGNDSAGFNVGNEAAHPWGDWVTARSPPGAGLVCRAMCTSNDRGLPIAWRNSGLTSNTPRTRVLKTLPRTYSLRGRPSKRRSDTIREHAAIRGKQVQHLSLHGEVTECSHRIPCLRYERAHVVSKLRNCVPPKPWMRCRRRHPQSSWLRTYGKGFQKLAIIVGF